MRFPPLSFIRSAPAVPQHPTTNASETNEDRNHLAEIPSELLVYILSFLPAVDLANAAIALETSKVLPSIGKDCQLWRRHTLPAIPELPPPPTQASWQRQWRACPRPLQISILKDSLNLNVASRHEINAWRLGSANHNMAVSYVYQSSRGDNRHNHAQQFAHAVGFFTRHDMQPPSQFFASYAKALLDKGCTYVGAAAYKGLDSTLDEIDTYLSTYKMPPPEHAVAAFMRACSTKAQDQDSAAVSQAASRLASMLSKHRA